jgi:hypothetical protein
MTDEPFTPREPGTPPSEDDARDEQVAAALAVEPLDDLTRRRLVSTAADAAAADSRAADADAADPDDVDVGESGRQGRSRLTVLLPVAAAIAIGVVVGALVVTRPDDSTTTAARQDTNTTVAAGAGSAPAPQAAANPPALNESSALKPLGDLGDVSQSASLKQAVTAARSKAAATTPTGACADIPPADLGLASTSAAGTGTASGQAVNVVVGTDATGETIAVVLRSGDCLVIRKDVLPPG